jgi:hypothetical protein
MLDFPRLLASGLLIHFPDPKCLLSPPCLGIWDLRNIYHIIPNTSNCRDYRTEHLLGCLVSGCNVVRQCLLYTRHRVEPFLTISPRHSFRLRRSDTRYNTIELPPVRWPACVASLANRFHVKSYSGLCSQQQLFLYKKDASHSLVLFSLYLSLNSYSNLIS